MEINNLQIPVLQYLVSNENNLLQHLIVTINMLKLVMITKQVFK